MIGTYYNLIFIFLRNLLLYLIGGINLHSNLECNNMHPFQNLANTYLGSLLLIVALTSVKYFIGVLFAILETKCY